MACDLQHSQAFHPDRHWHQTRPAQLAVDCARCDPTSEPGAKASYKRCYRRLVHALTVRNGDCRKLSYLQAAR
jgi:hypothetical protein